MCNFGLSERNRVEKRGKIENGRLAPLNEIYSLTLTHCILVDSSTLICWMSPFVMPGVSSLFYCFYSL